MANEYPGAYPLKWAIDILSSLASSSFPATKSFKADDEYTRTVLAMDIGAAKNKAAQFNLPAIMRWLENPQAIGFAKYLDSQSERMDVLSPDGLPMARMKKLKNSGRLRNSPTTAYLHEQTGFIAEQEWQAYRGES